MHSFLVYSPENQNVADNIAANLKTAGIKITHDTRRLANRMEEYKSFSNNASDPIILLVSDNFLKDKECMYEALNFLQNPSLKNRVFPIITDGRNEDALGGINYTTTKFERVSNVIHYMNYWQDQYLEMRKIKRELKNEHLTKVAGVSTEAEFEENLSTIRDISRDIGEFFRILRTTNYTDFETFTSSKYEAFFRKAGWNNAYATFREKNLIPFVKEESTDPGIDISTIPGINLIKDVTSKEEVNTEGKESLINEIIDVSEVEEEKVFTEEVVEVVDEVLNTEPVDATLDELADKVEETIIDEEEIEIPPVEGSNLLNKVSDYKNNLTEEVEEILTDTEIPNDVEEVVEKEEILENEVVEETQLTEKEAFEKEGLSYQDKSSYELLVSLFEDDTPEEVEESTNTNFITESLAEKVDETSNEIQSEVEEVNLESELEEITEKKEESTHSIESIKSILNEGDTIEGMKMLKEVLTIEPENTAARYEYAMLLSDQILNYKEAKEQLETVVSLDEDHLEAILRLAELNELDEDYINAKECYEKALVLNTDYPGLHHKYAALLNNNFKVHKKTALKHYKIAVEQDEGNVDALYQLAAMQYEFAGKPKKALKKFQKVIQLEPSHPFANYDIAVLYYEMGKPKLAAQYYYDAYQNNPELRTDKNDEAFKVDTYLFAPKEELSNNNEDHEEILDEIMIDDVSDLTETFELTEIDAPISKKESNITFDKIEELLGEEDSFEDLEDELEVEDTNEEEEPITDNLVVGSIASGAGLLVKDVIAEEEESNENTEDELIEEEVEKVEPVQEVIIQEDEELHVQSKPATLAFITGATSGIGKATAYEFAKKGHNLIITGRRADRLETIKNELVSTYGISVETLEFDVRNLDACRKAMDSLDERFKNVDILLNNAGLARGKSPIHEGDIDHWDTMIDTNIKGLLYMTRLVAPGMVSRGKGHIINIGSIAGKEVYPNGNVYCATKHAVDALTKSMRIDLHKYNIRVSAIHPGAVEETEFSMVRHDFDETKARDYQDFTPVNARDIAEIVHFVATRPSHVNIQDLLVMGTQQATATITDNTGRK